MSEVQSLEQIVPFGKYRGRPIADMLQDSQYLQWLTMQPWFREKFGTMYVLVTEGVQPRDQPTPEHNAVQARFVSPEYRLRVLSLLGEEPRDVPSGFASWEKARDAASDALKPIADANEAKLKECFYEACCEAVRAECAASEKELRELVAACNRQFELRRVAFEQQGWDVVLADGWRASGWALELKPTVGDEYPAIVRTVRQRSQRAHLGHPVIAFDRWVSEMPLATVQAMFDDLRWVQLPPVSPDARPGL